MTGRTWPSRAWLRWALVEASTSAIQGHHDLREYYERRRRNSSTPPRVATARRFLTIVYLALSHGRLSFGKTPSGPQVVDLSVPIWRQSRLDDDPPSPPAPSRALPLRRPPSARLGENWPLRQQLAVYRRTGPRPRLRPTHRLWWVALARVWTGWRQPLVIVTPDTVLRWQRRRFREYWTRLSGRPPRGRPCINAPDRRPCEEDGCGESLVGCTSHPRRARETRYRRRRAHRLPAHAEAAPPGPLRPGGPFSPTMSATSFQSTSSPCPPLAFASYSCSSSWPTTPAGSCIST